MNLKHLVVQKIILAAHIIKFEESVKKQTKSFFSEKKILHAQYISLRIHIFIY